MILFLYITLYQLYERIHGLIFANKPIRRRFNFEIRPHIFASNATLIFAKNIQLSGLLAGKLKKSG